MKACNPFEILVVTTESKYPILQELPSLINADNLRVLHVSVANKRLQVCKGIPIAKTPIIVLADDDVTWPRTILPWLLAPFESKRFGGVGTCQRTKRLKKGTLTKRCYNWLGAAYIERRNFEISATHNIDGGTSCMSGRTVAVRSEILQQPHFLKAFAGELWGKSLLKVDDDNFITRWLVSHQWKTWIQYEQECEVETTLENNWNFLFQCARWARSNLRSNTTTLFIERHVWLYVETL
jgi:cellulose synthase/poly-beta-1,6-N-acetylglucosamine synthase-like glycosyltransferase